MGEKREDLCCFNVCVYVCAMCSNMCVCVCDSVCKYWWEFEFVLIENKNIPSHSFTHVHTHTQTYTHFGQQEVEESLQFFEWGHVYKDPTYPISCELIGNWLIHVHVFLANNLWLCNAWCRGKDVSGVTLLQHGKWDKSEADGGWTAFTQCLSIPKA